MLNEFEAPIPGQSLAGGELGISAHGKILLTSPARMRRLQLFLIELWKMTRCFTTSPVC